MTTYRLVTEITISMSVEVQAASLDAAMEKASEAPVQGFCHQCVRGEPECWNTSGELDGDPNAGPLNAVYVDGEELAGAALKRAAKKWSGE